MAKIKLKETPEQIALIRAMASKNRIEAEEARYAFAEFVGGVIKKYINLAPTVGNLYNQLNISEYEPQTLPLDDFRDLTDADYYRVVMQPMAGGLATNFDYQTDEIPFQTFILQSAVSMYNKYLRAGRLDHAAKALNHLANEILKKREVTSVSPILYAIATESTNGLSHAVRTNTADVLTLKDFVDVMTRASRMLEANIGGTPLDATNSVTDMVISPEVLGQLREMAFQPQNTRSGDGTNTSIAAPESFREEIFRSAGIPSFYDVNFLVANELGDGKAYNTLFKQYAGGTSYTKFDGSGGAAFTNASDQVLIGINARGDSLVKPIITDGETGASLEVFPDDQFQARAEKQGYFAKIQEGAIIADTRYLSGLIL